MLKPIKIALLTAIFASPVFFVAPAFSQGKPVDGATIGIIKAGIRETAQKTKTLASDFTQEKEMSMIREKIISKGKFYFKKERMLRWEYLQPFNYLIIIRDEQISIKDDNKVNQFNMMSNKVFQEINRIILGSIRGTLVSDEKNFKATFYDSGTAWVVKLKTLSPGLKSSLSEINIYFDRKDYSVNRLEMAEPGGDFTRITFSDKKVNQPMDDEKFLVH
jgi:outer membrane lipoprotein-sorting protein